MINLLGEKLLNAINRYLDYEKIYEIRLRANQPVRINYGGEYFYLCKNGLSHFNNEAIVTKSGELDDYILKASNYSLYSVEEQLKKGYLTIEGGIRMGICGECVCQNDKVINIKNVSSINIRIPHEVIGSADTVMNWIMKSGKMLSTLIISPPGRGKTTILRDIARQVSEKTRLNILIADERNEISASEDFPTLNIGATTDVMRFCNKAYAFGTGVRVMRPDLIITDELYGKEDWESVEYCQNSGVCVIASLHGNDIEKVKAGRNFISGIFQRYVILTDELEVGKIRTVYDENYLPILQMS